MNRLFILLVVFCLCIAMIDAFGQNTVVIVNALRHQKTLRVHCKSGDDNLGYHYLKPGEKYDFSFGDNIWQSTLFWCHLRQGWEHNRWKHHQVFVAYESSWNSSPFTKYKWVAADDGIYFTMSKTKDPEFKFGWDVPLNPGAKLPAE